MSRLLQTTKLMGLAAVLAALFACGNPTPPPAPSQPTPRPRAPEPPAPAEEEAEASAEETYSYSPIGKRDPFRSYAQEIAPVPVPTVDPDCGELCTWELSQLRLVAVVWGMANPEAMVEDPRGHGHMIRRGMSIGKRSGKVTEIHPDRLVVTEIFYGPGGQVRPMETEVPLRGRGATREDQIVDLIPQDEQE